METVYARLEGREFEFLMLKRRITIGRNSKLGGVDVNMGNSRFISRRHLDILMERNQLYLICRGKNGVFVDDIFQKRENKRLQLPNSCIIRFPSTQIKLALTSLIEEMPPPLPPPISPIQQPLRIDTTLTSPFVSPMPSPTGTISAVNSCPASPNSIDQYARRMPFELMAKYASKLLASQQQRDERPVETEGSSEADTTLPNEEEGGAPAEQLAEEKEEGLDKGAVKPPYSYAQLIVQALLAPKDRRQTLSGIYNFIAEKYPFYKLEDKGWKNSIRHNLSLNQYFMKAPREKEGLGFGKGGYWCMHPDYEEKLTSQAYVKRKKKGIPVFPSAGLLSSKSAPSSPTHHPLMASDFALREMEAKFTLPHTPPSQFTLPPSLFQSAMHSSSSLPASPSRPHPGFAAASFKYIPLGVRSTSVEALAPEVARKRDSGALEGHTPQSKRTRSGDEDGDGCRLDPPHLPPAVMKTLHPMSLSAIAGSSSFSQPPTGVQFYQIPMMNQPSLPTFLSQGFIKPGGPPVGLPSQQSPTGEQNERSSTSHDEG